jgi:hypothetical protein
MASTGLALARHRSGTTPRDPIHADMYDNRQASLQSNRLDHRRRCRTLFVMPWVTSQTMGQINRRDGTQIAPCLQ